MVAMVAFVFRIVASSAHGGKPFCSDSRGCVWFEASGTDGSVLKRNVWPRPKAECTHRNLKYFFMQRFGFCENSLFLFGLYVCFSNFG